MSTEPTLVEKLSLQIRERDASIKAAEQTVDLSQFPEGAYVEVDGDYISVCYRISQESLIIYDLAYQTVGIWGGSYCYPTPGLGAMNRRRIDGSSEFSTNEPAADFTRLVEYLSKPAGLFTLALCATKEIEKLTDKSLSFNESESTDGYILSRTPDGYEDKEIFFYRIPSGINCQHQTFHSLDEFITFLQELD